MYFLLSEGLWYGGGNVLQLNTEVYKQLRAVTTKSWSPLSLEELWFYWQLWGFRQRVLRLCLHLTHPRSAALNGEVVIAKSPSALDFVPLEIVWEDYIGNVLNVCKFVSIGLMRWNSFHMGHRVTRADNGFTLPQQYSWLHHWAERKLCASASAATQSLMPACLSFTCSSMLLPDSLHLHSCQSCCILQRSN